MADISAFGTTLWVTASITFPLGFPVASFSDSADPFDSPPKQIADVSMDINGNIYDWKMAKPNEFVLSVLPVDIGYTNLNLIWAANNPQENALPINDNITIRINYPISIDNPLGLSKTLSNGKMLFGSPAIGIGQDGKKKAQEFRFMFGKVSL